MIKTFSILSCTAFLMATAATAQSEDPPPSGNDAVLVEMDIHVSELANDALSRHLDDTHKAVLKSLAHQHAVAANCEAFEIDEARNAEELAYVLEQLAAIEDEDSRDQAVLVTMMGYATYLGGQHAIAAYDYDAFCAHAAEAQEHEGTEDHLILIGN